MSRIPFALAAVVVLALIPSAAATAAPAGEPGYVRVGHLSPDTAPADVSLSALAGGTMLYSFSGVPYGGVSPYMSLAPGTYALAMVPAEPGTNTPVVSAEVNVTPGMAVTIVAVGPNAGINLTTIEDDLTPPAAGMARARVVHAATTQKELTVRLPDGTALATDADFGDIGDYRDVPPGVTELTLVTATGELPASVDMRSGAAQTLFVLDDASGGLTILPLVDSASVTAAPVGGMATGGGALAGQARNAQTLAAGAGVLALLVLAVVVARLRSSKSDRA